MELFIGTKLVQATPMTRRQYNNYRGWAMPAYENGEDAGYFVEYLDGGQACHPAHAGYISWSPEAVFRNAYRSAANGAQLTFGDALTFLKRGHRVARAGWNGKGMWLYYVPANSYKAQTDAAKAHFGDTVPYRAYIAIVTAQGDVEPWLASQSDVLESDWMVLPSP